MQGRKLKAQWLLAGLTLLVLLAGLAGAAGPERAAAADDKIEPELVAQLGREGQGTFLVYLEEQADLSPAYEIRDWDERGWFVLNRLREVAQRTQPAVLAELNTLQVAGHVSRVHPFYIANLIVVHGDLQAARALARLPEVAAVYPDLKMDLIQPVATERSGAGPEAVEWNIEKIHADQVWATYGVTGTGVVVANIDTGVEYDHPALVQQYRGNLGGGVFEHDYNWWDPQDLYDYPYPVEGAHGTHVMGTEVGDDGGANQIGVAPGAKWIAAAGCCPSTEALLSATEWMIAPWQVNDFDPSHPTADPTKRPHVVNNSWGGSGGRLTYDIFLQAQRAAGVLPVMSAGNSGPSCGTIGSPGDNPTTYSVGATDANDNIAGFSSRGPDPFDSWFGLYGVDPDVSAPGVNIRSSVPGGDYEAGWSGTSMASPHVSGLVGLILSAEPDLIGRLEEIEELIRRTALPLTSDQECGGVPGSEIPNNTYGWGRIDALAAVDMIWHAGTLAGTVTDAGSGAPIEEALILASRDGYTLTTSTDAAGAYDYLLGEGSYEVTVLAYGYAPWTQSGVDITQDATTFLDAALTPLPVHTLSGTVEEGALQEAGDPLYAHIGLRDTAVDLYSDRATGAYTTPAAEGDYWMRVVARGYRPEDREITVTGDLVEDVALEPTWAYYLRDSRSPCGPAFDWIDATDGEPHAVGDDSYFYIALTDTFSFYGVDYSTLYVGSNGFISFGQGYGRGHMIIPYEGTPNNAIYGLEEDLNPANGAQGLIYHKYLEDGRYLVIEFYQVEHWASGYPETFEFILDMETGTVLIQYLEVSLPDFATVGIENADGSDGILYSYANSAGITNSLAVGFYPVYGRFPADQDEVGAYGTLSGTVYAGVNPVPGAEVVADTYLGTMTTTAGGDGDYLFPDVCADRYWLQASAPGYVDSPQEEARLRWDGDVAVTDLYLCQPVTGTSFSWVPLTPTVGQVLTLTASASGTAPITFNWDLGDGTHGHGPVPMGMSPAGGPYTDVVTHTYTVAGDYEVTITATNACGEAVVTDTLFVCEPVHDPAFSWMPLTPTVGQVVTLTASASGTAPIDYVWHFGDGMASTGAVVTHVYTMAGDYEVTLTATNACGEAVVTGSLAIVCEAVHDLAFSWAPPTPTVGQAVTFEASAGGTAPILYHWDFGDQFTGTGVVVQHTYAATGTYTVTVRASNACGEDVVSDSLTVQAPEVVVAPPQPETLQPGEPATRTMPLSNTGEAVLAWSLEEDPEVGWLAEAPLSGTVPAGGVGQVTLTYTAPISTGHYSTVLRLHSNDPANPVEELVVTLHVTTCVGAYGAEFVWVPLTPTVGQVVTFTGHVSGTPPFVYDWDFGDGAHGRVPAPLGLSPAAGPYTDVVTHSYEAGGVYTVTLAVGNGCGDDHVSYLVTVVAAPRYEIYLPLIYK